MTPETKICYNCNTEKPLSEFHKNKHRKYGVAAECKECRVNHRHLEYHSNPELHRQRQKQYVFDMPEEKKVAKKLKQRKHGATQKDKEMLRRAKWRAKTKKLPFNIELSDIVIPDICPVLHIHIKKECDRYAPDGPSLDRIVPEKGYVKGNVRVISFRANVLKSNATLEEIKCIYEDALRIQTVDI